jgi:hypothetical protein
MRSALFFGFAVIVALTAASITGASARSGMGHGPVMINSVPIATNGGITLTRVPGNGGTGVVHHGSGPGPITISRVPG